MYEMDESAIREVKLCLFGDVFVGKSCLAVRFARGKFDSRLQPTIGAAFMTKTLEANDCCFKYNIWDTAGQEKYHALAPMFYRGAAAAVIVYDITSESSFESVQQWVKRLEQNGPENIVIAVAGNKKDLADRRVVSTENGQSYADEIGAIFIECSALTGENINQLFARISQKLPPEGQKLQNGLPIQNVPASERECCSGP